MSLLINLARTMTRLPAVAVGCAVSACVLAAASTGASAQDAAIGIQRPRSIDAPRPPQLKPATTDFGDGPAAPDLPAVTPSDDPSSAPQDDDDGETRRQAGQRAVRRDGDLAEPDAPMLRDGVVETGEPEGVQDGVDPTAIDTRPREDAELFEDRPTASVDQLLFQVEELEPILDRRPQRLFRFEPYDPVGIRAGSFVLFPEAEFAGNAYSNVFRAPGARSDVSFDVRPSVRLVSNWRRHALEFRASGIASFYDTFTTENDKAYTLETRGRLDITKRTNLQVALSHDLAQESRSAPDARTAGTRSDVTTDKVALSLNHRFNRVSLQIRGSVTDLAYGDTTTAGARTDESTRNYRTSEQAVRASYEFKPTLSAFSEVALNQRDYVKRDAAGIDRSSEGERWRLGVGFGNTGDILRGEASVGYGVQRPTDRSLRDITGVIVDANVSWKVDALTSIAFNARSDFAETTSAGVGGVRAQSAGIEARHAFRQYLIATAGLTYTDSQYVGSNLVEDELRAALGVEYFLNRETVLFSRYAHTAFVSNAPAADYDSDEIRFGIRIRR